MAHPALLRLAALGILALAAGGVALGLTHRAAPPRPILAKRPTTPRLTLIPASAPTRLPIATPPSAPTASPYLVRHVMTLPGPFRHGDAYWNEAGAPAGPIVVTVDLAAQTLSVFRDGWEIGTAVILYGADDRPTPLGVFTVTQKDADHVSNLYGAPMPFMLRLTNDGVSIHGADVRRDKATHGCVGVPTWFARKLFGTVKLGDRVIVTRGERLQVGEAVTAAE